MSMSIAVSWRRFHSTVRGRAHRGSKIVVVSRTETHSSIGTARRSRCTPCGAGGALVFFRALAFGAVDHPDERPELARVATALCEGITDFALALFAAANMIAASLRADQRARSWRRVLKVYGEATAVQLDAATPGGFDECKAWPGTTTSAGPVKNAPGAPYLFYNRRKLANVATSELPKVTMLELLAGVSLPPAGEKRFEVLMWQSRIPPFGTCIATCDLWRELGKWWP